MNSLVERARRTQMMSALIAVRRYTCVQTFSPVVRRHSPLNSSIVPGPYPA